MNHLESFLQDIIDGGGEGIILRDPSAPYQPGRSSGYLKHKVSSSKDIFLVTQLPVQKFRDAEARVVQRVDSNQWECEL